MLARFKAGHRREYRRGDFQSHYDLGVAFKEWACSTRRLQSYRKRCVAGRQAAHLEMLGICFFEKGAYGVADRSSAAGSICRHGDQERLGVRTGSVAHSTTGQEGGRPRFVRRVFAVDIRFLDAEQRGKRSPRRNSVSQQVARVSLHDVQRPVAGELEQVVLELRRVIAADFPIVSEVNDHLLHMKGKLFRPTLLLLSHQAAGSKDPRAVTLAAVVELIHLATLVHDDSVDHSVLRRGLPTINALFSHQIAVIMGDYLYSRADHRAGATGRP